MTATTTQAPRFDLYTTVHKGVRMALTEMPRLVDGTDFANAEDRAAAIQRMREILTFLEEHAGHEDAHILPFLKQFAPAVEAKLERDHAEQKVFEARIETTLCALEIGTAPGVQLGLLRALRNAVNAWVAMCLAHMTVEETDVNQALWDHCSDERILQLQQEIEQALSPAEFGNFVAFMLPALNLPELVGFVSDVKQHAPPPVFELVAETGHRVLGEHRWARVAARV